MLLRTIEQLVKAPTSLIHSQIKLKVHKDMWETWEKLKRYIRWH